MRSFLIILSIIFLSFRVNGQVGNPPELNGVMFEVAKSKSLEKDKKGKNLSEKDIAGSPYLDKQFHESTIIKTNGVKIKDMPLRFNIYNNNMEFKKDGQVFAIAFPSEIQRINMSGKIFIYARYMTPKNVSFGFFQVLYEGDYQLLKKDHANLKTPDKTNPDDSLRFVKDDPSYYLRYKDGMAHLINSQKALIKRLQPVSQEIIDYIKSNKINTKNEKQLIDLMQFIEDYPN